MTDLGAVAVSGLSTMSADLQIPVDFGATINGTSTMAGVATWLVTVTALVRATSHADARITVLRHRTMTLGVNAGAYADKSFSTTLTAASGPGIRQIGQLQEQVRPQTTNYV